MRSLLLPRSPAALLGGLAAVLNGVARVAIVPLFVTPLFDDVLQVQDTTALPRVLLVAAVVAVGGSLALWAQDALLGRAAADLSARWRSRIYKALLGARPGRLPGTSGGLASRIINDLKEIETYIRFGLGTLVAESVTLALIFVLLVRANATAALALVALALPTVLALRWLGGYLQRASERSMNQSEVVGRHLQEGLRHLELVRAFGAREYMHERFEPANDEVRRAMAQRSLIAGLQAPLTQVLVFVAVGVLVLFLVAGVSRGTMTVGDVIAFLTLVALATTPTQLLPHGYAHLRQAAAAAKRLGALVGYEERPEAPVAPEGHAPELASADGPVGFVTRTGTATHEPGGAPPLMRLEGVSFSYPGGRRVLEDVWLRLPPTGLVVLSGPSGSGKTTLLRLLLRFDQPTGGAIHVGNTPLADVPEEELRRLIAYVPQDHGIISGRVRDVLTMGRMVDDEQVRKALEAVGMLGAVGSLPGGLSAELGEDGGGLSGGQRQRLAIARALLGNPAALLLDEPTSNLDDASENEIVALLARLAEERLVLAVTHRPALAEAADSLLEAVQAHAVA